MSTLSRVSYFNFARTKMISQAIHYEAGAAMIQVTPDLRYRPLERFIPTATDPLGQKTGISGKAGVSAKKKNP